MSGQNNDVSRSWFVVFNNPENHGYTGTPEKIIEQLKNEWIQGNNCRRGHWAYCISATGTPHVHMVLENSSAMRFSTVKKAYPQAHLEPTKGNKKQIMAYIKKEPPFDEKDEKVICTSSHGEIKGSSIYNLSTRNDALQIINQLIEQGMTPSQIRNEDIRFYSLDTIIKKAFFDYRFKQTPLSQKINVIWHLGESGSGKTYTYISLCNKYGDENVYLCSDYSNGGKGGFDNYEAQPILFLDELKTECLPFHVLLGLLEGYKKQIPCRYANTYSLWNEVHIASIFSPEEIYESLVSFSKRKQDSIQQLLRRITTYVYHYIEKSVDNDGQIKKVYKTFELPAEKYVNYKQLLSLAHPKLTSEGFTSAYTDPENPFQK